MPGPEHQGHDPIEVKSRPARFGILIGKRLEVKYSVSRHLSRCAFKKFVGIPPGTWRKKRLAAVEGPDE
jgi:hypothetical protein